MAETKALAPLPVIEPKVPLPLLEAHAELAAACDDWHDAKGIQYPSPGYPPKPALRKDTSTEFVCYVAQQPHVAMDEIEATAIQGIVVCLVLGAGLGVFVLHPLLCWSASKLEQWFPLGRSRRTPT